ncbi:hypothetical protein R3P38DRAFT_2865836 [Favolaschia claudopus]|uniref:F-box domain-containing protein n=1 Tax=Favolaschia claudopus TaxID=2862362 RepID=A0AAW0DD11_9AGAR
MKNHFVQVVDRARQGFKRTRSTGSESETQSHLDLVPPELWLQIFAYLSSHVDLKAVSLTCISFRQLAQPLLFTRIYTHPPPPTLALRGIQTTKYRRRTTQRLDFFLSPLIAPAVRECWIDPPSAEEEDLPTDVLIDAIFDGLRKLPNLKVLGCRSIRLASKRLEVLRCLSLTTLTLESCLSDVTQHTHLPALSLSSATFRYHEAVSRDASLSPLFSFFLSPRHLQRLASTSTEVIPVLARRRSFTRLLQLEIPVECLTSTSFISALSHCPSLERITLLTDAEGHLPSRSSTVSAIPKNTLPNLKFYRGPRNFAALFASTGRLQTVELSIPVKVHRLLRTLGQLKSAVDFLSFRVDGDIPKTLLESIHTLLPSLRTLSINDPPVSPLTLHTLLEETTPRNTTRVFRMRVEGRDRYNLWVPPVEDAVDALDCYKKIRSDIERVYPNLSTLKLLYGVEGASVVWRRNAGTGQLVQATAVH